MLNGTLSLHDIRDVEAFCTNIAEGPLRQHNPHQQEDLIAYLVEECWILSTRYQPGGITFSTWARATLQRRIHDHLRKRDGRTTWQFADRTYERERPILVSIDEAAGHTSTTGQQLTYDHAAQRGLHGLVTETHRDPPPHGNPSDLVRLLRTRSSDEAWRDYKRRTPMPSRAA